MQHRMQQQKKRRQRLGRTGIAAALAAIITIASTVLPIRAARATGDENAPAAAEGARTKTPGTPPVAARPYTGIVIDARYLPSISRSPAPSIYGPAPNHDLLYPDRAHVPTPDEVQEQSVVRYYVSEEAARKGFVGDNPLILKAVEVVSPAQDSLRLSAEDMEKLRDLDEKIRFTRTWKVGFLVPTSR